MEFGLPVAFPGHKFLPDESTSWSSPEAVIERAPFPLTGESALADQTSVCAEMLWYQIEKIKRFGVDVDGQNPAAKTELGERRIWFWLGLHGESEEEKFCCCSR